MLRAPASQRNTTFLEETGAQDGATFASMRPGAQTPEELETLFEDLAWHQTCAVALAGALPYRKYGLILRLVMKQIARSAGHTTDTSRDHELTSWPAVDRFAEAVARLGLALDLRAEAAPTASYV